MRTVHHKNEYCQTFLHSGVLKGLEIFATNQFVSFGSNKDTGTLLRLIRSIAGTLMPSYITHMHSSGTRKIFSIMD